MNTLIKWIEHSLSTVKPGETATIVRLSCDQDSAKRLTEMGLLTGTRIKVISGSKNRPFIVNLMDFRIGITWELAEKIMVTRNN